MLTLNIEYVTLPFPPSDLTAFYVTEEAWVFKLTIALISPCSKAAFLHHVRRTFSEQSFHYFITRSRFCCCPFHTLKSLHPTFVVRHFYTQRSHENTLDITVNSNKTSDVVGLFKSLRTFDRESFIILCFHGSSVESKARCHHDDQDPLCVKHCVVMSCDWQPVDLSDTQLDGAVSFPSISPPR